MFASLRKEGATIEDACARLEVSTPTGWRLAKELRDDFLDPEADHALPMKVVYALRTEPRSVKKLQQIFPEETPTRIENVLLQLTQEGRVRAREGRTTTFEVTHAEDRIVGPTWAAKLGALKALLRHVAQTVDARLLKNRPDAFARTIDLRLGDEQRAKLEAFYEEQLWPFLGALEREALESCPNDNPPGDFQISLLWSKRDDSKDKKE